jgi:ribosomal protein S27E
MNENMDLLKVRPNTTKEKARKHPSIVSVYKCPKCDVGHALTTVSSFRNVVKCNICGDEYRKP